MLQLVIGLKDIFSKRANIVTIFDDSIKQTASDMLDILYSENALGIGANMVGVLDRVIVVDLQENSIKTPYVMINPEIIDKSENEVEFEEASLSFPGVNIKIKRPEKITVIYNDLEGAKKEIKAEGLFARVIQHEIDYLNGITIFNYVSKMKREILIKKMNKIIAANN